MGNVKKLCQSLIPLLLLPFLGRLANDALTLFCSMYLGSMYTAVESVTQSLLSLAGAALSAVAIAGAALPALWMEEGKARAAKSASRWALILFCLLIGSMAAAFLLAGPALLGIFNSTPEIIGIGAVSLRFGALSILGVSLIAALIGQTRNACSMKTTLLFCAVMTVLWTAAGYGMAARMGVSGLGLSRGGVFAATRIAPFLMIPVKIYAEGFLPFQQEE